MKKIVFIFLTAAAMLSGQKKRGQPDVVSNAETRVIAMKGVGNNSIAKNLQTFYGFGFGGNLMTPRNFGIGLDYNLLFSNVKPGQENIYGNIGSPKLTNIDAYFTHRTELSEDLIMEAMAGFSYYRLATYFNASGRRQHNENGNGFNLGAKFIHTLDREERQQLFIAPKVNFYYTSVYNENSIMRRFYDHTVLLSLSAGYRYNF